MRKELEKFDINDTQYKVYCLPYKKKEKFVDLMFHNSYGEAYLLAGGVARKCLRLEKFGRKFTAGNDWDVYINLNDIKEIHSNKYLVMKNGGVFNLESGCFIRKSRFRRLRTKEGICNHGGEYAFDKCISPRVETPILADWFSELKNERDLYISQYDGSNETFEKIQLAKKFIDDLIEKISNFKHPRIGKVYVDIIGYNNELIERIYLHNEDFIDIRNSYYTVLDEVEDIIMQIVNNSYDFNIYISKNR